LFFFSNYEHIVKTHQNQPVHGQNQVPDEAKFQVVSILILHFSLNSHKNYIWISLLLIDIIKIVTYWIDSTISF